MSQSQPFIAKLQANSKRGQPRVWVIDERTNRREPFADQWVFETIGDHPTTLQSATRRNTIFLWSDATELPALLQNFPAVNPHGAVGLVKNGHVEICYRPVASHGIKIVPREMPGGRMSIRVNPRSDRPLEMPSSAWASTGLFRKSYGGNWLITEMECDTAAEYANNEGEDDAIPFEVLALAAQAKRREPIHVIMSPEVRHRVVRLCSITEPEGWLRVFESGEADQAYLDVAGKSDAEIIAFAKAVRFKLQGIRRLFEPVVVGPIGIPSDEVCEAFSKYLIRVTEREFDAYCERIGKIRAKPVNHTRTP